MIGRRFGALKKKIRLTGPFDAIAKLKRGVCLTVWDEHSGWDWIKWRR